MDNSDYYQACKEYFNGQYSRDESYWGDQPNLLVPLVGSYLAPGSRALVVGCGEGRDALFLARLGFDVIATEIAEEGLNRIRRMMGNNGIKLELLTLDAHQPHDHLGLFDSVLLITVLPFLRSDMISERIEHFKSLVKPGGIICVQTFTVEDSNYKQYIKEKRESFGHNTFRHLSKNYYISFFDRGELASYFNGWEFIHYNEGLLWDKPHGQESDFHQHGMALMIARKPNR